MFKNQRPARFGRSTHISMISNSVTHLRSYTNSAIADIAENSAPISPVTPRDRRRRRVERRWLRIERRYRHIEWWVFDDVLLLFHNIIQCITMFYMCFIMFYYVLCLASRATIGDRAAADCLRDRDNAQGSAITPQKLTMAPQGSSISPRTWSHAKLRPEWRLE